MNLHILNRLFLYSFEVAPKAKESNWSTKFDRIQEIENKMFCDQEITPQEKEFLESFKEQVKVDEVKEVKAPLETNTVMESVRQGLEEIKALK